MRYRHRRVRQETDAQVRQQGNKIYASRGRPRCRKYPVAGHCIGLASVPVGDFETKNVSKACGLTGDLEPLLIVCVGYPLAQSQGEKTSGEKKRAVLIIPMPISETKSFSRPSAF